ncbi:MAG: insulinase family protein [Chitinispirillaceae bacterium]|nr:insulinase family protein [Chitinispirillaceae bacterium]
MIQRLLLACTCLVLVLPPLATAKKPPHPLKISYGPLSWTVPRGEPYRVQLKNGLCAYVASDSQLPLVRLTVYVRHGTLLDRAGKEGESTMMATLMRTGGTKRYKADMLDALIDQYAMNFSVQASEDLMQVSAEFLAEYLDTGLVILKEMLFHPRFEQAKLDKEKKIYREAIRHRFDNPGPTADIAFQKAVYAGSAASGMATEQTIKRVTRNDLTALHSRVFTTGSMILAIAGKFDRDAMIARLEKLFPSDKPRDKASFPAITPAPKVKCLVVHKPITQVYVQFGLPLFKRPHNDYYPVSVANLILGGGGFTSRLGTVVRSDAGLTYSIHSSAMSNYTYPGTWHVDFFTKNESFSEAVSLALSVIDSLRDSGVSARELANAKAILIDGMPSMFRTPYDIVSTYAWNEYFNRPPDIFAKYADRIKAVTRKDLRRVINKYLDPSSLTFIVVGDTSVLARYGTARAFDFNKLAPKKTIVPDSLPSLP